MKDKIITSKKIIISASVIKDQFQSLSNFLSERFYSATKNHNSAIIIGSSFAHQTQDIEHDTILDSSGALITTDNIGFINGGRVAVVDGLGGGIGDQKEDDIINRIAYSTCETFLLVDKNIDTTLDLISGSTSCKKKPLKKAFCEDPHTSLAAFTFKYKQQGKYFAEFANIGDGLIIVLDKQYKIKKTLCARHMYRGFNIWPPSSVQMLTASNSKEVLIRKNFELTEGDIIISMSDGIWGELDTRLISQTPTHRDIEILPKSFETLFSKLINTPHPSAFDIAQLITTHAMSQSLEHRKNLVKLINENVDFLKHSLNRYLKQKH